MQTTVQLDASQLVQPTVLSDNAALIAARDTANDYLKADFDLVLGSTAIRVGEVSPVEIAQWVGIGEDLAVIFDEEAMYAWIDTLADSVDTVGTTRTYVGADGSTYTSSGGTYGWKVNRDDLKADIQEAIAASRTEALTIPCDSEGYTWTGQGQPDWGAHAEVDISAQHAWFFDANGTLLWESDMVSGKTGHSTNIGIFRILYKKSPATLTGDIVASTGQPEYQTPVTYWMPFTSGGQGFHDATWRSNFGGSIYINSGSHGCVNLPYSAAEKLYSLIETGNAVIVHD